MGLGIRQQYPKLPHSIGSADLIYAGFRLMKSSVYLLIALLL